MDFTYIVAGLIAVAVGVVGGGVFLLLKGHSSWRLLAATVPLTVAIDFALLLDWSRVEEMTTAFLLTDLAFFALYALVGCTLGVLPWLTGRRLYRMVRQADAE